MASTEDRDRMIDVIRNFPSALEGALERMRHSDLDSAGGEGEWTVGQVVHHVADAHLNAFLRTKLLLTEERPILKPFDQEAWARLSDTTGEPIEPSIWIIRGVHRRWSDLLAGLEEEAWSRAGVHLENGLVTLEDLLVTYSGHCETHLKQISAIRRSAGV